MSDAYQSFEDLFAQESYDWLQPSDWAEVAILSPLPCAETNDMPFGASSQLASDPDLDLFNIGTASWQSDHGENLLPSRLIYDMSILDAHVAAPLPQSSCESADSVKVGDGSEHDCTIGVICSNIHHKIIYPKHACATCNASLDTGEQFLNFSTFDIRCTRNKAVGHLALICDHHGCGEKFAKLSSLRTHCLKTGHKALCCAIQGCGERLALYSSHFHDKHGEQKSGCAQCGLVFEFEAYLDNHGATTMHAAYRCRYPGCGSESTRMADLLRHQLAHKADVPRHPCPHCRNYRGNNGFKRKDHLRQHIRNYHRIEDSQNEPSSLFACRQKGCAKYFETLRHKTLEELTDHMLHSHGSSAYVCEVDGCDRFLMNGFETDKLLKQHLKKDHPSAFQCRHAGCDRVGTKGWMRKRDMVKHMKNVHGITE